MQFADGQDRTGQIKTPSAGHIGPVIAEAVRRFDEIRGSSRLAFGPDHEVTSLVDQGRATDYAPGSPLPDDEQLIAT